MIYHISINQWLSLNLRLVGIPCSRQGVRILLCDHFEMYPGILWAAYCMKCVFQFDSRLFVSAMRAFILCCIYPLWCKWVKGVKIVCDSKLTGISEEMAPFHMKLFHELTEIGRSSTCSSFCSRLAQSRRVFDIVQVVFLAHWFQWTHWWKSSPS